MNPSVQYVPAQCPTIKIKFSQGKSEVSLTLWLLGFFLEPEATIFGGEGAELEGGYPDWI